jgi:outer membrane protein insertion porin family
VPGVFLFEGWNEIRSLGAGLRYRTVDDAAKPGHKTSTTLAFELAGGPLGGDLDWTKVTLAHEQRFVTSEDAEGRRRFLTARLKAGVESAFGDTPEVPPFARFYAGGNEFRGFRNRGIGPHSNGRPMGGEFILVGSVEYEHPIVTGLLSGVAFVDAGTLGTSIDSDDALLPRLSVGFGVRLTIAAFGPTPLALDFGFPLLKQGEDETTILSFSLSRSF